jgi:UDP-3-O-[3-hydroxymyristoyl] glucosamine N-acyltransferase
MAKAKKYRLAQIVERFGGEILGNPLTPIAQIATLENAGPQHIGFLANRKYRRQLSGSAAGAVIVSRADSALTERPRIVCDDPYLYFARVSTLFNPPKKPLPGIHKSAVVERGTRVPASASIGAGAYIGTGVKLGKDVVIGPGCHIGAAAEVGAASLLHARVTVYPGCVLGARAIVHSGAVIGADGFGIAQDGDRWLKIPQTGRVIIGDDVEIGANTCIDRGALDDTIIEDGVKLDNLIQIGHNVHIGAHTAIAGCAGVSGSSRIGRRCLIGGGAVIAGHLTIADRVTIYAASLVTKSIKKPGSYGGHPADESRVWARNTALLRNLDSMRDKLRHLELQISSRKEQA